MASLLSGILVLLFLFNLNLYYQPAFVSLDQEKINQDLLFQLNHLESEMHTGAAVEMQRLYPEGYVFLNALYGLSWIEVLEKVPVQSDLAQRAQKEVEWAITELRSDKGKAPFRGLASPINGVFYLGWTNYVAIRYLKALPEDQRDTLGLQTVYEELEHLRESKEKSKTLYLPSYKDACWPADNIVAMAAMSQYESLYPHSFESTINNWLKEIKRHEDSLGLISHSWICRQNRFIEASRGSSQSLILNFLQEVDSVYAREKFDIYKEAFIDYRFGLPGIREYPSGVSGRGDIDSGPVILSIGGAASIVGRRTMQIYGEYEIAKGLRNSIETFGMSREREEQKSYLFGQLIMADAFITWSNSLEVLQADLMPEETNWRKWTHFYSFLVSLFFGYLIFRLLRKGKSP